MSNGLRPLLPIWASRWVGLAEILPDDNQVSTITQFSSHTILGVCKQPDWENSALGEVVRAESFRLEDPGSIPGQAIVLFGRS